MLQSMQASGLSHSAAKARVGEQAFEGCVPLLGRRGAQMRHTRLADLGAAPDRVAATLEEMISEGGPVVEEVEHDEPGPSRWEYEAVALQGSTDAWSSRLTSPFAGPSYTPSTDENNSPPAKAFPVAKGRPAPA